jgi:hypothetical protein
MNNCKKITELKLKANIYIKRKVNEKVNWRKEHGKGWRRKEKKLCI